MVGSKADTVLIDYLMYLLVLIHMVADKGGYYHLLTQVAQAHYLIPVKLAGSQCMGLHR